VNDELIAIGMLWLFVFVYAIAAAIDFGAGFWSWYYLRHRQTNATSIANRYLSPSWEVTNVFVVLIVVALVSFFPGATVTLGTVLLVPASLVLALLAIRSAFLVYSHAVDKYKRALVVTSGITGFLIPAILILVLPITYGGFIGEVDGAERLLWGELLTAWSTYAYIGFAVASTLFLSSLLLCDYAHVAEDWDAYRIYRRDAVIVGPVAFLFSVLIVVTMNWDASWLYDNLLMEKGWILASVVSFAIGYYALFLRHGRGGQYPGRPRLAMVAITVQYLLAAAGYGRAHLPFIVFPNVTIESGFTDEATFHALFWSYIIGFAILTPGFIWFWRMFMEDKQYVKQK